jgi:hypothetical protein
MNFLKYFTCLTPLFYFSLLASPPVPFSGKLAVDGTNFHGSAIFSFSIVDQEGTEHWRHAEEQDSTIEIFVLNGRYVALLGGQGMLPLPADLFLKEKSLSLRVSVDLQDGQGMRLLFPDQQITSTPYALAAELAQLAERATIADGVNTGSITASMLQPELLEDLNRTFELGPISRDMLAETVRNDLNATITRDRLSADVRADLNRTVRLQDLSTEVSQTINRSITLSDLDSQVITELNNSIAPGSISLDQLSQQIRDDINATISRDRLSGDLLADLNRTVRLQDLSPEVSQSINRTISLSDLDSHVITELNNSIAPGSISLSQLSEQVRDDINATITRDRLSADVLADLNRTVRLQDLSTEVSQSINRSITLSDLDSQVITELNNSIAPGSISLDQLSQDVRDDINRSITLSDLDSQVITELNNSIAPGSISLDKLSQDVRDDINRSIKSNDLDPLLKRYFTPTINTPPVPVSVIQGANTSLTVSADGKFLTYQWKRNDQVLAGETSSTLSLNEANASNDDANYSVMVSNDWGSVSSENVRLTVATALPSVTLNGSANMTHEAATPYVDAGATAADALGNDLTSSIAVSGADVNVTELGEHTVSYSVTDVGGNTNSASRTVSVEDTTSPVLSLVGDNNHSHNVNKAWVDPGYSATDSLEGNLTSSVAISGDIDVNTTGEYTLTYSVSDSSGNEANVTRRVNVQPLGPWTFTNAGATGRFGPTQSQIDANYSGTSLEGLVTINSTYQGIQEWVVPADGNYSIEAYGAQGGGASGGLGAKISGNFILTKDSLIKIVVGQKGSIAVLKEGASASNLDYSASGGGGSYVIQSPYDTNSSILTIAGGGGASPGLTDYGDSNLKHGQVTTNGARGFGQDVYSVGGVSGEGGGQTADSFRGTAGGGFFTDGIGSNNSTYVVSGGNSFINGSMGGFPNLDIPHDSIVGGSDGGFGGGGGCLASGNRGSGGGGGYSGGGLGTVHGISANTQGGGGGSYNSGTDQDNQAGVNEGHGKVVITFVSP